LLRTAKPDKTGICRSIQTGVKSISQLKPVHKFPGLSMDGPESTAAMYVQVDTDLRKNTTINQI
jgi:hypothetical protein